MRYSSEIVATGFIFPETPRWHAGRQAFYFVDIDDGKLYELKDGKPRMLSKHLDFISGLTFDESDGFYVASLRNRKVLHLKNWLGEHRQEMVFANCSALATHAINDMIRSSDGSFYLDSINYDALAGFSGGYVEKARSPLLRITPEGQVTIGSAATNFPNGSVISLDGKRLFTADTFDECIYVFPIREDGSLGDATVYADLPGEMPDGMCGDVEGGLWLATRTRCIRVLEGGEITDEVAVGPLAASACMLGGADGRTLLITASDWHDRRTLYASATGTLLQARVRIPGGRLPSLY